MKKLPLGRPMYAWTIDGDECKFSNSRKVYFTHVKPLSANFAHFSFVMLGTSWRINL